MIAINLLTYNELPYVKNLIRQLVFADEIYICDAHSTDGTWEYLNDIKEQYGLKLFQRKWDWDVGEQRNYLLRKTPKDCWVIKIDADEVPTFGFRYMIRELLNSAKTNPPEVERIFFYIFNLVKDFNHYHEDIGVQSRIFWNSEKNNVHYTSFPHENIHGNWPPLTGTIKDEQGVVHLKLLDEEKVKIGRTTYVENRIYEKDHIGDVLASDRILALPRHIGFDVTTELINHLKLGVTVGT